MWAVAHAFLGELLATEARDRAIARVSMTSLIGTAPARLEHLPWDERRRRALAARVAFREAMDTLAARVARHQRWHRAFHRVRGPS